MRHNFNYLFRERMLMGSSAQFSSGVHWGRRRVRFTGFPEKVLEKVPGGFGADTGSGSTSGKGSGKGLRGLGAKSRQVQQGSEEGSGEGSGRLWYRA
jgi:hypothetical protein